MEMLQLGQGLDVASMSLAVADSTEPPAAAMACENHGKIKQVRPVRRGCQFIRERLSTWCAHSEAQNSKRERANPSRKPPPPPYFCFHNVPQNKTSAPPSPHAAAVGHLSLGLHLLDLLAGESPVVEHFAPHAAVGAAEGALRPALLLVEQPVDTGVELGLGDLEEPPTLALGRRRWQRAAGGDGSERRQQAGN